MKILIVEDELAAAEELGDFIVDELGASVIAVSTLAKARLLITTDTFDAIIADYKLPDGFGHTLFEAVELGRDVVRIIWSGDIRDAARCFTDLNGVIFLQKPVDLDALLASLTSLRTA